VPAVFESLELEGVCKSFGPVAANRDVSLRIAAGEVLALLGANGAGKTTLVNMLYGLYSPDRGSIRVNGRPVEMRSPKDALALGIGMVHQHFMLVPRHTAAENVALGLAGTPFWDPERHAAGRMAEFSDRYGLRVDPAKPVWQLCAGEQQRLEIVKALIKGAELLILDEPTSVLTDPEAEELFSIVRRMASDGKAIILITHKLEEALAVSSDVAVMREGRLVGRMRAKGIDRSALAGLMTGEADIVQACRAPASPGRVVVEARDLVVMGDMGLPAVDRLSFQVRAGELFGIAGVSGNGQKELAQALTGMRPIRSGRITVSGESVAGSDVSRLRRLGLRHIPEERIRYGIVPGMSVAENAVLTRPGGALLSLLDSREAAGFARSLVAEYGIKTPSEHVPANRMSGGNIQKLILGREIEGRPALIVAAHPTYGLDIAASELVRDRLLRKRSEGCAVLLISEDLDEVLQLSDRVAVMSSGRFMDVLDNQALERRRLMLLMAGSRA
jgi:simple sugar transport system ATP-binding protein